MIQPKWKVLVSGIAQGEILTLGAPLSFWGGYDAESGRIIDSSHPNYGQNCKGKVLVLEMTKGSSSSSSVFAEAIRNGTSPSAIILGKPCGILVTGALVAQSLYGLTCPIVLALQWPLPLTTAFNVSINTELPEIVV